MSKPTQRDRHRSKVCFEIPIVAVPAIVFALLTDPKLMSCWLAQDVMASPYPGGVFRLWDPKGCWIEGAYVAAIPDRLIAFTWGGIEGLRIGQSIVTFTLESDRHATVVALNHTHLPDSTVNMHRLGFCNSASQGSRPSQKVLLREALIWAILQSIVKTRLTYRDSVARSRSCIPSAFETCLGARNTWPNLLSRSTDPDSFGLESGQAWRILMRPLD